MLGFLVAGLLLPLFSRMLKERSDVSELTVLGFRLVLAGSLAVAVFGSMNAHAVMGLRYSEHVNDSAPAFALLVWCFVAVCTTYIFGTLLTASGALRRLNMLAGAGALLNIGLNLVLIPIWKAEGAAWASLVTQVITALVQLGLAITAMRVDGVGPVLARAAAYVALLAGACWVLGSIVPDLGTLTVVFALFATGSAFATGLVRWKDLLGMSKLGREGS